MFRISLAAEVEINLPGTAPPGTEPTTGFVAGQCKLIDGRSIYWVQPSLDEQFLSSSGQWQDEEDLITIKRRENGSVIRIFNPKPPKEE